jgi:hypothetical protein
MKIKDPRVRELFEYLSRINQTAYQSEFLLANDVLAKTHTTTDILTAYPQKQSETDVTPCFALKKILLFYVKNISWWAVHLGQKLVHLLSGQNYSLDRGVNQLTLVDAYFLPENITREKN